MMFRKLQRLLAKISPELRRRLFGILGLLLALNCSVWGFALFSSYQYPVLLGLVTLAYALGLRHAVDADHIAAIDNATRKLMQDGKTPVGVGLFFSLGHSTIVLLLSLAVALSASYVKNNLSSLHDLGSLIGTSVSAVFLLIIGTINLLVLIDIFKIWRKVSSGGSYDDCSMDELLDNRGLMARLLRPFLKSVRSSWNMYFVGFLFGLGFDTASEIGLLSISAATGVSGLPFAYLLLLPLAFAAGMSLIDTLDGILMLGAYGWATIKPIRKLYYNMNITFISVVIALFIGSIEAMQVIFSQLNLSGGFFDVVKNLDFGHLGYIIIGTFIGSWLLSIGIYKARGYEALDQPKYR